MDTRVDRIMETRDAKTCLSVRVIHLQQGDPPLEIDLKGVASCHRRQQAGHPGQKVAETPPLPKTTPIPVGPHRDQWVRGGALVVTGCEAGKQLGSLTLNDRGGEGGIGPPISAPLGNSKTFLRPRATEVSTCQDTGRRKTRPQK